MGIDVDTYFSTMKMPITFDARVTFLKGKVSPTFIANIGYAVGLNGSKGGLVINPQIGIKTYITRSIAYLFNIGLKLQSQEVTYGVYDKAYASGYRIVTEDVYYKFITISTGIAF